MSEEPARDRAMFERMVEQLRSEGVGALAEHPSMQQHQFYVWRLEPRPSKWRLFVARLKLAARRWGSS